jgi:phage baseplate assembly protein W
MRLFVEESLKTWEKRIFLDTVRVEPQSELGRVDITITYHLRETYSPGSLVYPFYLQPLEEAANR